MGKSPVSRGVSREQWLQRALDVLREQGIDAVKVSHLAASLEVAVTGFYWHFKNRAALLQAMLEYWEQEYTAGLAEDAAITDLPAGERLFAISDAIARRRLTEFDPAISAWAMRDPQAAALLKHAYELRMTTIKKAFRELGFRGDELEMRTRLFVCYHSNEEAMFGPQTDARATRLRRLRLALLTRPHDD